MKCGDCGFTHDDYSIADRCVIEKAEKLRRVALALSGIDKVVADIETQERIRIVMQLRAFANKNSDAKDLYYAVIGVSNAIEANNFKSIHTTVRGKD